MKKVPNAIQDFGDLAKDDYLYIDKTGYIRVLEDTHRYVLFTRPRRFGKSLWISTLDHYYGIEHADNFSKLFGNLEIGRNPTPERNSCHILRFDFSGISDRGTLEDIKDSFQNHVMDRVLRFCDRYDIEVDRSRLMAARSPARVLDAFLQQVSEKIKHPIYVLIDEYDHFTHSLMAGRFTDFKETVTRDGFYRSFFEILKVGAKDVIRRIFLTGVTPVTFDAMTSGFNIAYDATREPTFEYMMGFTEDEVRTMIAGTVDCPDLDVDALVDDLRALYNGYRFTPRQSEKVYNPAMVLHYIDSLARRCEPPVEVLTASMSTDASKLRELALTGDVDGNVQALETISMEGRISSRLVQAFRFDEPFRVTEFISMLYYIGVLTMEGPSVAGYVFTPPNTVVRSLHLQALLSILEQRLGHPVPVQDRLQAIETMLVDGDPEPFLKAISRFLEALSNRDKRRFDEKYVKLVAMMYLMDLDTLLVHSEPELTGIPGKGAGYADLYVERRDRTVGRYDALMEFKYLKKGAGDDEVEAKLAEAEEQLRNYIKSLDFSKQAGRYGIDPARADMESAPTVRDDLIAIAVVYRGTELGGFRVVG